jgi:predicted RNase H-like HicB family nuclease
MSNELQYLIIIEQGQGSNSYGAYVPDLPGCVAVGESREEVIELIRASIEMHLEDLQERGEVIPPPASSGETVAISAA